MTAMERPLTRGFPADGSALDRSGYERIGGYGALRKAVAEMAPGDVTKLVKEANLRGRGGAGFNTGLKWSFVPQGDRSPRPKYLAANADEMEPGAFKDRYILERNPHLLLEGMAIAAYAIQAEVAYIFLRWAYKKAEVRLRQAMAEAYDAGYLGAHVAGSDFRLEVHLHVSAGRYMCGEETGLLNAIEGRRANPRYKPPYPQYVGLWGKPTVVNNVETLSNVPGIVSNGADWYRGLSRTDDGGTKLYGMSGKVRRPGLWELPMGTTMREILEEHAGGMREGFRFRAAQPGGGSTAFMLEQHLDATMDFGSDSMKKTGSRLGTGTICVLDDRTCPVGMQISLQRFFAQESCGWCTPCREGLPWVVKLLEAIEDGRGKLEDLDILAEHARWLGPGNTFCALAPGAVEPLKSGLEYFRDEMERHIVDGRCPWRSG